MKQIKFGCRRAYKAHVNENEEKRKMIHSRPHAAKYEEPNYEFEEFDLYEENDDLLGKRGDDYNKKKQDSNKFPRKVKFILNISGKDPIIAILAIVGLCVLVSHVVASITSNEKGVPGSSSGASMRMQIMSAETEISSLRDEFININETQQQQIHHQNEFDSFNITNITSFPQQQQENYNKVTNEYPLIQFAHNHQEKQIMKIQRKKGKIMNDEKQKYQNISTTALQESTTLPPE